MFSKVLRINGVNEYKSHGANIYPITHTPFIANSPSLSVDIDECLALLEKGLLLLEGADRRDSEKRLAKEGINRGFGNRFKTLHLTRGLKVEALEEEEDEEEDRNDDEDERSNDGDRQTARQHQEQHHEDVF